MCLKLISLLYVCVIVVWAKALLPANCAFLLICSVRNWHECAIRTLTFDNRSKPCYGLGDEYVKGGNVCLMSSRFRLSATRVSRRLLNVYPLVQLLCLNQLQSATVVYFFISCHDSYVKRRCWMSKILTTGNFILFLVLLFSLTIKIHLHIL